MENNEESIHLNMTEKLEKTLSYEKKPILINTTTNLKPQNYFIKKKEKLEHLLSLPNNCQNLTQTNKFLQKTYTDLSQNQNAIGVLQILEEHQQDLESEIFEWIHNHKELKILHPFFLFLESIKKKNQILYLNLESFRKILPIRYFENYFKIPFISTEEDINLFSLIHSFQSSLLTVFNLLYIKSFMIYRPIINAEKIISIDPFMRTTIRKENILFYMDNFPGNANFDLYEFIKTIIDQFALSGAPKWRINNGRPFIVALFEMINDLFEFGIISLKFSKELISVYYLVCDMVSSLERKIQDEFSKDELVDKYRKEFILCRENTSLILIQIIALFSDVTLEETQNGGFGGEYFGKFLFKEKSVFNYFSHIVIKYLSQNISFGENSINSKLLKQNLSLIFNFIGDFQNDFFIISMDLINEKNYEYYYLELNEEIQSKKNEVYRDARFVNKEILGLILKIKKLKDMDILHEFQEMINSIESVIIKNEDDIFFKLECCKRNTIALFINLIDYIDDGTKLEKQIIIRSLIILQILIKDNYVGQGTLFRGNTKKNFENIMKKRNFLAMMMLKEVFKENSDLIYMSDNIFYDILKKYKEFLMDFDFLDTKDTPEIRNNIIRLFYFNEFLFNLIELHKVSIKKRKKFDIMIAQEIYLIFNQILPNYIEKFIKIPENEIKDIKLLSNLSKMNLKNLETVHETINNLPKKVLFHQMFYNLFRLFNKSTYRVFSGEVYVQTIASITLIGKNMSFMNYEFSDSILLRLQYVKLFDRFMIFFPNHLITERAKNNPNPVLFIGEIFLKDNYDFFERFIKAEFFWYEKYMSYHKRKSEDIIKKVKKYLIKGLLALIYKFLKGIKCHISILIKKIAPILRAVDSVIDEISARNPQFERLLLKIENKVVLKTKKNLLKGKIFFKKKSKNSFSLSSSQTFKKTISEYKEERPYSMMSDLREKLDKGLFLINAYYKNKESNYLIKRYSRMKKIPKKTPFMENKLKSSLNFIHFQKPTNLILMKTKIYIDNNTNNNKSKYQIYYKPLIKEYIKMKSYYNHYPEKNQFYQILNDSRDEKYIKTFLLFFIDQISIMEMNFLDNDPDKIFLINDYFIYLFIIVDNLIKWNSHIRDSLLEILNSKEHGVRAKKVFEKIWSFFILLYLIVMYKTFMDDDWMEYWSKFYVLSKFLQNLCEKNNQGFKLFLNEIPGSISKFTKKSFNQKSYSLYFELYILLETSANFSNFWLNSTGKISPSDKSEMFLIFKRLMDHTTEHFTGPCLKNQLKVYVYRIDIWSGIIKRIIDDTDSDFYKLKLSCLNYISGLLEGLNDMIVTIMGSNFQIHELFGMSMRLLKKLYIRLLRKRMSKNNFKDFAIVTKKDEDKHRIKKSNILQQFYLIYEEDFSENILLDVVIQTYFLMKNMAIKIKFYEYYLIDKNEKIKDNKNDEENLIFDFIKKITSKIEVVDDNVIKIVNFKKEPKTLLLSLQTKKKFIENMDHTNLHTKHIDIFDNIEKFDFEMRINKKKYSKIGTLYKYTTKDFFTIGQIVLYFMSILLNIFMLKNYEADHIESNKIYKFSKLKKNGQTETVVDLIAFYIIIFSFILSIYWLIIKLKSELKKKYLLRNKKGKKSHLLQNLLKTIFMHPRLTSYLLHFFFTSLGYFFNNWYYTFNLFLISNLSKTISYILEAIIKHYEKLIVVLILTILIIYSYSFLLINHFNDKIKTSDYGNNVCNDFLNCFLNGINMGVRMGGGISDLLFLVTEPSDKDYWQRFYFDTTFFILIQLISLNIFSGIIIDTFGDMRDALTVKNYHERKVCFICGLNKWQIEKMGQLFNKHRRTTHHIWDYVAFMIRLHSGNQNSFTGQEYKIYQMLKNEETSWFPKGNFLKDGMNEKVINNN